MIKPAGALFVAFAGILVLIAGVVGAQWLWMATHHRYDSPETGAYYGFVSAHFTGIGDSLYTFDFQGQTPVRWFWNSPTNFTYSRLSVRWFGAGTEGEATVQLPSLSYQCSNSAGMLTDELLAEWLLGNTNAAAAADLSAVHFLYGLLTASGRGALPPPNHHGYSFDTPSLGHIQHFQCGYGVGWPVCAWIATWISMVWYAATQAQRKRASV